MLSIVIPVYHEEKNIAKVLRQIHDLVKTPHEVEIIYDSKDDLTLPVVRRFKRRSGNTDHIKLIANRHKNGSGALNAVLTGFSKARGRAVILVNGDLSDKITDIDRMAKLLDRGFDIVCGSRYMPGGRKIGGPITMTVLSRLANFTLNKIFRLPTHDATNTFKLYRKEVLDHIKIESTGGFEFSLEIIIKAFKMGYRITEIPTVWQGRTKGESKFNLCAWLPKYIQTYLTILH